MKIEEGNHKPELQIHDTNDTYSIKKRLNYHGSSSSSSSRSNDVVELHGMSSFCYDCHCCHQSVFITCCCGIFFFLFSSFHSLWFYMTWLAFTISAHNRSHFLFVRSFVGSIHMRFHGIYIYCENRHCNRSNKCIKDA